MNKQDIIDVLGLETSNYTPKQINTLVKQFNKLLGMGYEANNIWLKEDYFVYTTDNAVCYTKDLVACKIKGE